MNKPTCYSCFKDNFVPEDWPKNDPPIGWKKVVETQTFRIDDSKVISSDSDIRYFCPDCIIAMRLWPKV